MKRRFTLRNKTTQDQHSENVINVGPSETALKNILNYSRSLAVVKSKFFGNINVILN